MLSPSSRSLKQQSCAAIRAGGQKQGKSYIPETCLPFRIIQLILKQEKNEGLHVTCIFPEFHIIYKHN
jgi:hypothetical protein